MQLCTHSYHCNVKQSVGGDFPPTFPPAPLQNCSRVAAVVYPHCSSFSPFRITVFFMPFFFAVMQKKRATVPPQTTPGFLDVGVKQGLVGERSDRKPSNVRLLSDDEEKHASASGRVAKSYVSMNSGKTSSFRVQCLHALKKCSQTPLISASHT